MTTTADLSLAKLWLSDCVASHPNCPQSPTSRLPSRILDLGLSTGTSDLRLRANVKGHGRYATLSHCWGKSQPLQLTQATNDEFQHQITYESLPKTFQDAVTTTRLLGLRYLWIDSLCIMQDSKPDWEEQCAKMADIYKNSFVTLAGAAASDCESGFLHPRPTSYDVAMQLSGGRDPCEFVLSYRGVDEDPLYASPEPNSPLSSRAWVLQERLLSRRVLYFGTRKMYLECFTNVRFDDCHHPTEWDYVAVDMVVKQPISQFGSHTKCFGYWAQLVTTYSSLDLTNIMDRLPALSGLASEFQSATGAQYLAGVWREDMPRALNWHVPYWDAAAASSSTSHYIAPSWSWAAINHGVVFASANYKTEFHSGLDIITAGVTTTGCDPFGVTKGGFINLSGRIQRVLVKESPDLVVTGRRTLYVQSDNPYGPPLAVYAPDDASSVEGNEFSVQLLYMGTYSLDKVVAMALKPVDNECDTYQRVGLALSDFPGHGPGRVFADIFQNVAETRIHLI